MASTTGTITYQKQAEALLKAYNDAANALAAFAAATRLHPAHVEHMQNQINQRTKMLVKQIAVEHVDIEVELPSLDGAKG